MRWSPQKCNLSISTLKQLYQAENLQATELFEAVYERIAGCPVPHIQTLEALAETLEDFPRVTGSAT